MQLEDLCPSPASEDHLRGPELGPQGLGLWVPCGSEPSKLCEACLLGQDREQRGLQALGFGKNLSPSPAISGHIIHGFITV